MFQLRPQEGILDATSGSQRCHTSGDEPTDQAGHLICCAVQQWDILALK